MTVHLLKSNFARGEVSPKVWSRIDLDLYEGGAERVRNFYNVLHGGLRRRSGTRYAGKVKTKASNIRFVPFVFNSTGQAYVLEFGDLYIRFWTQGGQLVSGMTPVEVVTGYTSAQVFELQFAQTGDTMFIAHPSHKPRKLVRASHTSWSIDDVSFVDGPYYPINDTDTTVTGSADLIEGTSVTITFSATAGVNNNTGLQPSDVGRQIRIKGGGTDGKWTYGVITARASTTVCTVRIDRVGGGASTNDDTTTGGTSTTATKSWRLGAFSGTTGNPGCVAFFEGRLVWANTTHLPRTLFFSRAGLPYDYCPSNGDATVTAENGFYPTILAGLVDEILWLCESNKLLVGTSSGIRTISAQDTGAALSAANVTQKLEISSGATKIMPTQAGAVVVYAERFGKALRNVYFSFEQNTLVGPNFTDLSDHLFKDGVKEIAYQQVPEGIIWARTSTGALVGITYNREEKVVGFHRHDFGGSSGSEVETICVIPGTTHDELWLCMRRTINGVAEKYVEVIDAPFQDQDEDDAFFVDCGATYDGALTATVSGLSFLNGETVSILADGAVLPQVTVSGGAITLPNSAKASKIQIGLQMVSECKLLRPPHQQQDGIVLGRNQRATHAITEVIRTGGLQIGIDGKPLEPIRFRKGSDLMGSAPPLANGEYRSTLRDSWSEGGQVYYYTNAPLPVYIRSTLVALDTEGTP